MNLKAEELKQRTAAFAKAVIALCADVPHTEAGRTITKQLIESSTSVSANYRATCRARSPKEFISKIGQVVEEADESLGWLKMLVDTGLLSANAAAAALQEANELTAIFAASLKTAKANAQKAEAARRAARDAKARCRSEA